MLRYIIISCVSLIAFFQLNLSVPAQDQPLTGIREDTSTSWHISADAIHYDGDKNRYTAMGSVIIKCNEDHLTADSIQFSPESSVVTASGNASLTADQDVITGSLMALDLSTETGRIENASLFSTSTHFTIAAESIEKTGRRTYAADNVVVTACEGDPPAWRLTGKRLDLAMGGYGTIIRGVLWVKNMPVFYVPILPFPTKTGRQSGFLTPRGGVSDRQGLFYDQPYFLAIDPHSDATVYARYMSHRGIKGGLEYRYAGKAPSKGAFMMDGLIDRKVDAGGSNGSRDPNDWGYPEDDIPRPNPDRYWVRMKLDQSLPFGFQAEADVDIVSDQDYLREFKSGHNGYDRTSSYFREHFKREIDRYDDPVRMSRFNVRKAWNDYSVNGEVRWYDDVVGRRNGQVNPASQRLPAIGLNALKQRVFSSPLYYSLDTNYTYFHRESGRASHRTGIHTRFYMPYRILNSLVLEPSLGLYETIWHPDASTQEAASLDGTVHRGSYDFQLDLSTTVYRIFSPRKAGTKQGNRLKHMIRPRLFYEYAPDVYPSPSPVLDEFDRQHPAHRLAYGLTNILISRAGAPGGPAERGGARAGNRNEFDYRRILRLDLGQSYDLRSEGGGRRGRFSPVFAEIEFTPTRAVSLVGDASWSVDESRFTDRNIALTLEDYRNDELSLEYRYARDATESIAGNIRLALSEDWSAYGSFERNILERETIKRGIGFAYHAQCWSLGIHYSEEEGDTTFEFSVNLLGFDDAGLL